MEEEINLRPYFVALIQKWWWIVIVAFLGVIALVITSLQQPPNYSASTFIAIIEAQDVVQFDLRFTEVNERQPLRAFPSLAKNDVILQAVAENLEGEYTISPDELDRILEVNLGADSTLLEFKVVTTDPRQSMVIVNSWSEEFVRWANESFGDQSDSEVIFYETQLNQANELVEQKNNELIEFQSINRTGIISNTLEFKQSNLVNYLTQQEDISSLRSSIDTIKARIESQDNSREITYADQLIYLRLLQRSIGDTSNSIILFDTSEELVTSDSGEFLALIDNLQTNLDTRIVQLEEQINELEPEILNLQQEQRVLLTQEAQLLSELDLARELSTSLTLKFQQERLTSSNDNGVFRLVSQANIPEVTNPLRLEIAVILGAIIGGILGIVIVLINTYLKSSKSG